MCTTSPEENLESRDYAHQPFENDELQGRDGPVVPGLSATERYVAPEILKISNTFKRLALQNI
jgi:hypothetical protein